MFLFLSLAGFISSCVSDVEIDSSNNIVGRTNGPPTIDEAKALLASCGELSLPNLGKNMQKGIQVRAIGKLKYDPTAVVPDWAVTQTFTEDDATILMTPLEIAAPISGITRTFVDGKENREAVQVYSKLLVKKNAARQMLGVIVTYLPDRKYWEEDGCDINKLGYELGGTNYSGIYMVSSLDGTLIHGAKFDKGELLFRFYPNWRKDMDKEHECQHTDSAGHEACEHDASQAKYKLNIELLDARHNVLSRSRSTEGENFICSFCGRNAMECNCLTIDANYICSVCHNEIVNGKCRCCSVCRNSPCRCCYTCRNYPCTCGGPIPPTYPPITPPTGPINPGGGSTGGGGSSGGNTNPDIPQKCTKCGLSPCVCCRVCNKFPCACPKPDPCPGPKCPECKKLLSFVTTRAINEGCEACKCMWWEGGHHSIIDKRLSRHLTKERLEALKRGGDIIDKEHQATDEAHMHAMRSPNQSRLEALEEMKTFFVTQMNEFYRSGNYEALGMALHPIMDAYSPPHQFKEWEDDLAHLADHAIESTVFYPTDADNAAVAIENAFLLTYVKKEPGEIFDRWADDYRRQYPNALTE